MRFSVKTLLLLALCLVYGVSTQAKDKVKEGKVKEEKVKEKKVKEKKDKEENEEVVSALTITLGEIIHKYQTQADTIAIELSEKYSNNSKMQTAIAKAYFQNLDCANSCKYLDKAMALDPNNPEPYLWYGKMFDGQGYGAANLTMKPWNADSAAFYFNKAIELDPKNPAAYIGLAKAQMYIPDSMRTATATLEKLREINPAYDVDMELAQLHFDRNTGYKDIVDNIGRVDPYKLPEAHIAKLLESSYWAREYMKGVETGKVAMERFPNNMGFARVTAWCCASANVYGDAVRYGEMWEKSTSKDSLDSRDIFSLGVGNLGINNVDKGFEYLARLTNMPDDEFASQLNTQIPAVVEQIRKGYVDNKEYDKGIALMEKYLAAYTDGDQAYRYYTLSDICRRKMSDAPDDAKKPHLEKLFSVYKIIEERFPEWENIDYITYNHARYLWSYFDPNYETLEPEPYYKKLYQHVSASGKTGQQEMAYMEEAAKYLMLTSYFQHKDVKATNLWAKRLMEVSDDPEILQTATTFAKIKSAK